MKNYIAIIFIILIGSSLFAIGIQDAEARRFGGGRSFGSKPFYRTPYRKPAQGMKRSPSQQQAHQKNQAARQNMTRRGGLMGMLGGLALGGLLGSLLFGGAFENFNFMDILVFGGIAYLLFRLFAAKKRPVSQTAYQDAAFRDARYPGFDQTSSYRTSDQPGPGFDTDVMSDKSGPSSLHMQPDHDDADFAAMDVPTGFDEQSFLAGAKSAYIRLQKAWDNRDLAEIRALTTDKVFVDIQEQLKAETQENHTDVLKIEAELLEIRTVHSRLEAVVLFDGIIRENPESQAEQVREVWHFVKPVDSSESTWYLDGIQQLEE